MSESSALWLRISPDSSRLYLGFLITVHLLASIGSLVAGIPGLVQAGLILAIICSCIIHLNRYRRDRGENRPSIVYGEQEGWSFRFGTGPRADAELLTSSIATRWITILHFRAEQNRFQSFVILPDSLDPEDYRRLRMILKITEKKD